MNKTIFASLAMLPVVTASVLSIASEANAAPLVGEFSISPGINVTETAPFIQVTNATLFADEIRFTPDPGALLLSNQSETFSAFNAGSIKSIPTSLIPSNGATKDNPLVKNFLDLGDFPLGDPSITDETNTFSLLSIGDFMIEEMFDHNQRFTGTSISLGVSGFFTSADGQLSNGTGTITFQSTLRQSGVEAALDSDEGLDASFSGVFRSASVPEPTTLAGLGLVAGSVLLSRSGKKKQG
ncbi:PEP-CTERM sorting domain-containing protein [Coleofasciculus sp. F4-SAH-05]|uniref:PEP-CTERM sorting domain-containing protein n=1 Tax=Coleofasciculus sp. F4-SAH-05 TaxID=3069525 RepID=UPI0032F0DF44